MSQPIQKALQYAKRWGVDIHRVSLREFQDLSKAYGDRITDGAGLGWIFFHDEGARVLWPDDAWLVSPTLGSVRSLLHEVHHFVIGGSLGKQDELRGPQLALDYLAGRALRIGGWRTWQQSFYVPPDELASYQGEGPVEWNDVARPEKRSFIKASIQAAQREGLLTSKGLFNYLSPRPALMP